MKKPVMKLSSAAHTRYTEVIAEYIIGDLVPLSTVQSKHFKALVREISGGTFESPARTFYTETLLPRMMNDCIQEIKDEVKTIHGIGLTTDSWTSLTSEHYIGYTAHYINKDWVLKSKVLSTDCSEEKHTSEYLAKDMIATEQKWELDGLLFKPVYVHDNASNITKAPKIMGTPRIGIGCLAHTINLAAGAATSLRQVSELLLKGRKLVTTFKRSTLAATVFKKKQELLLPEKQHKLILDCPTRWNSSYDMLQRLNEQSQVSFFHDKCQTITDFIMQQN